MKTSIVVPTIREDCIIDFVDVWDEQFQDHQLIVVEDNEEKSFSLSDSYISHYSRAEIEADLGEAAWIIPERSSAIKSYGIYKAFESGSDIIVVLDDDCYPTGPGFLAEHMVRLSGVEMQAWVSTISGIKPRGMPYYETKRRVEPVLNHGLWLDELDLDAPTRLVIGIGPVDFLDFVVPRGAYFPMCGMNIAFKREIAPAMYFLLMGKDYPYDRFDDIWCGIFMKRICDHLGYWVSTGRPMVKHRRASDVWVNLQKETPGLMLNETLWQTVDRIEFTGMDVPECYLELADKLPAPDAYWEQLKLAMRTWASLFISREDLP